MNPRVSRSSALASKATGFPIAKIAAKLALGYHLDEIPNDITRLTPASFEPTIDYVVVKFPRWNFEKFPQADPTLTTQMKSVGEAMAIGRTFKEAFLKAVRSLEHGKRGTLFPTGPETLFEDWEEDDSALRRRLVVPTDRRMWALFRALPARLDRRDAARADQHRPLVPRPVPGDRRAAPDGRARAVPRDDHGPAADAEARGLQRRRHRRRARRGRERRAPAPAGRAGWWRPTSASTPAPPSSSRSRPTCTAASSRCARPIRRRARKSSSSAAAPTASGRASSSTTAAVTPSSASARKGFETVMVNCNPETVSTDYDTADRLYFEPLTFEDVMAIVERERGAGAEVSCVVQFGGQTPLKLALALQEAGVPILGTSPDSIDLAEDRKRFSELLRDLGMPQPASGTAVSREQARAEAERVGYPGGRAPVLRARRSRHGDRVRRRFAGPLHDRCRGRVLRSAGADRPVPRRRLRVRRGRGGRSGRRRGDRRHHGAHRGGGHPLGRQLVRGAALHGGRAPPRHDSGVHPAHRSRAEGGGADEHPVRHQGRRGLRARGEPAVVAHGALYLQGHGDAAGQGGRARVRRPDAGRAGPHRRSGGVGRVREESGVSVRPFSGRGHHPRPRDEVHGRGDGRVRQLRLGLQQGDAGRRASGCRRRAACSSA